METTTVTILPDRSQIRLSGLSNGREVLKAVRSPVTSAHPTAARSQLEAVARRWQHRLSVALCADELDSGCNALGLLGALGFGEGERHVDVVPRTLRPRGPQLSGLGNFRELRRLIQEGF